MAIAMGIAHMIEGKKFWNNYTWLGYLFFSLSVSLFGLVAVSSVVWSITKEDCYQVYAVLSPPEFKADGLEVQLMDGSDKFTLTLNDKSKTRVVQSDNLESKGTLIINYKGNSNKFLVENAWWFLPTIPGTKSYKEKKRPPNYTLSPQDYLKKANYSVLIISE